LKKGQTLVEVVVAIGIAVSIMTACISMIILANRVSNSNKQRFVATTFAQDALEKIRNIRDTNLRSNNEPPSGSSAPFDNNIASGNVHLTQATGGSVTVKGSVVTGIYKGNHSGSAPLCGKSTQSIGGLGFQPELVIVGTNNHPLVFKTKDMSDGWEFANISYRFLSGDPFFNGTGISNLDDQGFTVGDSDTVNHCGTDYFYIAYQYQADAQDFKTGWYWGNGKSTNPVTGLGFKSDLVMVRRQVYADCFIFACQWNNTPNVWKTSAMPGATSFRMANSSVSANNLITSLDGDGFTLGSNNNSVNQSGYRYYYMAFKDVKDGGGNTVNHFHIGSYNGNGGSNTISGVSFQPAVVWMQNNGHYPAISTQDLVEEYTDRFDGSKIVYPSGINQYSSDGFTLGNNANVNAAFTGSNNYYYIAWNADVNVFETPDSWKADPRVGPDICLDPRGIQVIVLGGNCRTASATNMVRTINIVKDSNPNPQWFEAQVTVEWLKGMTGKVTLTEKFTNWRVP